MRLRMTASFAFTFLAVGCDGSSGTDGGVDSGAIELTCASYCDRIEVACAGAQAQFSDTDSCLGACAAMPLGTVRDTAGNTLGCRIYHVAEVEELGDEHCHHAGPSGDDTEGCGTTCESFCTIVQATCTGANEQYADVGACMTACEGITDDVEYTSNVTSGDSLACRLYHATVAASSAALAEEHCPHTAVASVPCS